MKVINPNDVKIYNVSAGKAMPEWISDRKRRTLLKTDVDLRRRIQLLQDFEMPAASTNLKASRDGRYILATGVYPPRIRCYELAELGMKFERFLTSEPVQFEILSEDYSKLAFLSSDRYLEVHAQYGSHYKTRIPRFGRDLAYLSSASEILAVGDSAEVYRLNLELGRFMQPWKTEIGAQGGLNCASINSVHELVSVGSVDGRIECWDPRTRSRVGMLDVASSLAQGSSLDSSDAVPQITTLANDVDGLSLAVGTSSGHILLYDIRSNTPLLVKDHQYGLPIKRIKYHQASGKIISADTKIIKIWERHSGDTYTSIETESDMNDLLVYGESGLLLTANEDKKMQAYYVPSIGPAPRWCSFLDSLTEELEESVQPEVYDDYKFVTRKDLESLGLSHLIGTNLLRAYMHGFFIDLRLYHRAKAVAEPFAYEEYRKNKIKEKLEAERANRIRVHKRLPKVNKEFAKLLLDKDTQKTKVNPMQDSRFGAMFTNPEFEIDTESDHFKFLHPTLSKNGAAIQSMFKEVKDSAGDDDDDEEDSEPEGKPSDASSSEDEADDRATKTEKPKASERTKRKPKFFEIKDAANGNLMGSALSADHVVAQAKRRAKVPLGQRVLEEGIDPTTASRAPVGAMEMTFVRNMKPKRTGERSEGGERGERGQRGESRNNVPRREHRGVRELRLKSQNGPVFWRGQRVK